MSEQMDASGRKIKSTKEVGSVQGTPETVVSSDALPCETSSVLQQKKGMAHAYTWFKMLKRGFAISTRQCAGFGSYTLQLGMASKRKSVHHTRGYTSPEQQRVAETGIMVAFILSHPVSAIRCDFGGD